MTFGVFPEEGGDTFIVVAYDLDTDERYTTVFEGLRAKERAEEYAKIKNKLVKENKIIEIKNKDLLEKDLRTVDEYRKEEDSPDFLRNEIYRLVINGLCDYGDAMYTYSIKDINSLYEIYKIMKKAHLHKDLRGSELVE